MYCPVNRGEGLRHVSFLSDWAETFWKFHFIWTDRGVVRYVKISVFENKDHSSIHAMGLIHTLLAISVWGIVSLLGVDYGVQKGIKNRSKIM